MTQALHTAPVCEKHGCEKRWIKNRTCKAGGRWRCRECAKESERLRSGRKPMKVAVPESGPPSLCKKHGSEMRFHKNKAGRSRSGGQWVCLLCSKERNKKSTDKNPERVATASSKWRSRNPARAAAMSANWKKANPERTALASRKRYEADPTKQLAAWHRRQARKRNATVPGQPVTAAAIAERLALFDGCAYCGADKNKKLTVDHFIALNDGGLHVASNLVGACGCCNSSKCDKPVEEWFRSQPFFSVERWERLNGLTCA